MAKFSVVYLNQPDKSDPHNYLRALCLRAGRYYACIKFSWPKFSAGDMTKPPSSKYWSQEERDNYARTALEHLNAH